VLSRTLLILLAGTLLAHADTCDDLFLMINQSRVKAGLNPLTRSSTLDKLASQWAETMASRNSQTHRPLTKSLLNANGWKNLSENIYGPVNDGSAKSIFNAWMSSSGHKENLLRESSTLGGVGIAQTKSGAVCAVFNGAQPAPPQPVATSTNPPPGQRCGISRCRDS
jgi:uncharacterized protein YkwD